MELNLSAVKKNEMSRLILITIIGLLDSLENGLLTIEDCERYLFSPYTINLLEEKGLDEKIIEIIELGCELEDIQSLLPTKLKNEINSMKNQAYECLKEIVPSENDYEVKKWVDK